MSALDTQVVPYRLATRRPWHTATTRVDRRDGFLLRIRAEDGREAYGDAALVPGAAGPTMAACARALADLERVVRAGRDPVDDEDRPHADLLPPVRHAWVQARLTLDALARGRPLARELAERWFGGRTVATRVRVNATLPIGPAAQTVEAARRAVEAGYRCLKLKTGPGSSEVDRIAAVRRAVGPEVALRLDANGSWSEEAAPAMLQTLARHALDYVEQPLPPGPPEPLERLSRASPIPIAADESAHDPSQARDLVERGAIHVIILKPMALGGLDRAAQLARLAQGHRVRAVVTDSLESAVGRTGALHVAALLGPGAPACGLAGGEWLVDDVAPLAPRVLRGALDVPTVPGLGLGGVVVPEASS